MAEIPAIPVTLTDADVQRIATAVVSLIQQPHPQTQENYTVNDLAAKLQLSRDTVINRIRKGEFGDVIRDGKRYRITAAGLQQYIDSHTGQAYSPAQATQKRGRTHINPGKI